MLITIISSIRLINFVNKSQTKAGLSAQKNYINYIYSVPRRIRFTFSRALFRKQKRQMIPMVNEIAELRESWKKIEIEKVPFVNSIFP